MIALLTLIGINVIIKLYKKMILLFKEINIIIY